LRQFIKESPGQMMLEMALVRAACSLPAARQRAVLEEISSGSAQAPVRAMAASALKTLGRVGAPLKLEFTALDGRAVNMGALKGKVVLIDFWSTTCVPCVRELPSLKKLYDVYKPQGLEILGLTQDTNKAALEKFVKLHEITWPQYFDPAGETNEWMRTFEIGSIPVVWLVDRQGVLRDLNARTDTETKIKALLDEK